MKKLIALASGLGCALTASASLEYLASFSADTAEIISFDPASNRVWSTSNTGSAIGAQAFDWSGDTLTEVPGSYADFSNAFGSISDLDGISSVAADPMGRGFGVAALIPSANTSTLGKLGFFNTSNGQVIGTLDVGYHPDAVIFSPDGQYIILANEGEYGSGATAQVPGSVSVVNVGGLSSAPGTVDGLSVNTYDFDNHLASGVNLDGIRVLDTTPGNAGADMEPEYVAYANGKVFASLQENNAIAVLDVASGQFTAVNNLGTINQRIDASDDDGGIFVNDMIHGMPMPDTIAAYEVDGKTYVVSANEGDVRDAAGDEQRVKDIDRSMIDDTYEAQLDAAYSGNFQADDALGRLNVSDVEGLNSENEIEQLTMYGTRSFTIWDEDGALIYDSRSFFEDYIAANDPDAWDDGRSDNKGPEPEALTLGMIDGKTYLFVAMERTQGIFMFDISDPENVGFMEYISSEMTDSGDEAPESLVFLPGNESPNGKNMLLVGYEDSESIAMFQVVPEPRTYALMAGIFALGLALWRRRKLS